MTMPATLFDFPNEGKIILANYDSRNNLFYTVTSSRQVSAFKIKPIKTEDADYELERRTQHTIPGSFQFTFAQRSRKQPVLFLSNERLELIIYNCYNSSVVKRIWMDVAVTSLLESFENGRNCVYLLCESYEAVRKIVFSKKNRKLIYDTEVPVPEDLKEHRKRTNVVKVKSQEKYQLKKQRKKRLEELE